jgi:hypothetical protein
MSDFILIFSLVCWGPVQEFSLKKKASCRFYLTIVIKKMAAVTEEVLSMGDVLS